MLARWDTWEEVPYGVIVRDSYPYESAQLLVMKVRDTIEIATWAGNGVTSGWIALGHTVPVAPFYEVR
jgi:hypothetical protein